MADQVMATRVVARVETPGAVAARLPKIAVVLAVPRQTGWISGALDDVARRIRTAVADVVRTREERKTELGADLRRTLHAAVETRQDVQEAAKTWCVTHTGPQALEVLCENLDVRLDSPVVSFLLGTADKASEADRSRMYSALAKRVIVASEVLQSADAASHLLGASRNLPWQAPAHADIAQALTQLEIDLAKATDVQRTHVDAALGATVAKWVDHYASHQRIAVVEEVAALSQRPEVLERIGARAQEVHAVDPRLTYRLVSALIDNKAATPDVLRPFMGVSMWTQAESMALASRTGYAIAQRGRSEPATSFEP